MPLQPWRQPFTAPLCGEEFRFNLQKPWSGISTCWSLSVPNKAFLLQPWRDVISLLVHLVGTPVWLVELLKCASTSLSILSPWSWCLYKPFLLSSSADKKTEVQVLTSKWQIQDPPSGWAQSGVLNHKPVIRLPRVHTGTAYTLAPRHLQFCENRHVFHSPWSLPAQ